MDNYCILLCRLFEDVCWVNDEKIHQSRSLEHEFVLLTASYRIHTVFT